jgi:hypothetical protein
MKNGLKGPFFMAACYAGFVFDFAGAFDFGAGFALIGFAALAISARRDAPKASRTQDLSRSSSS